MEEIRDTNEERGGDTKWKIRRRRRRRRRRGKQLLVQHQCTMQTSSMANTFTTKG